MSSPRVFGLSHLSEDAVAAFADGVLSANATSRARRHCAECPECAAAVRVQREAAMLLRTAPAPALPSGLLDRLAGLPMSTPLPPPRGGLPTVLGADGTPVFVAHDVHQALTAAGAAVAGPAPVAHPPAGHPDGAHPHGGHPDQRHRDGDPAAGGPSRLPHRRGTLPATMLASAAAVVAAGTFGGHVSSLAASSDRPVPAGAAQVSGALGGGTQAPGNPATGQNVATDQSVAFGRSVATDQSALIGTGALIDTGLQAAGLTGPASEPATPVVRPSVALPDSVTVAGAHRRPGSLPVLLAGYGPMSAGVPAATP